MSKTSNLLFVYGTLLAGDSGAMGRSQRERLAREARTLGVARTAGQLFNLGLYPALTIDVCAAETEPSLVHGALLELADPVRSLKWLDTYEGIVPGEDARNDYERVLRPVVLDEGAAHSAWLYVWRASLSSAQPIASGNWLDR